MKYYRIEDDLRIPGRWHLGEAFIHGWHFTEGKRIVVENCISIPVNIAGAPLGFTFASLDMPVVRAEVGQALVARFPECIQLVPVTVADEAGAFAILNITERVDCLDRNKSEGVIVWEEKDGQPDKIGQYRMIGKVRVSDQQATGRDLFRLAGWEIAIICSERVRDVLIRLNVTGIKFGEV